MSVLTGYRLCALFLVTWLDMALSVPQFTITKYWVDHQPTSTLLGYSISTQPNGVCFSSKWMGMATFSPLSLAGLQVSWLTTQVMQPHAHAKP